MQDMHWPILLSLLFHDYRGSVPHLLVLHLGDNDLGLMKGKAVEYSPSYVSLYSGDSGKEDLCVITVIWGTNNLVCHDA